ncbi:hypothetical protein HJG54_18975 [Leptolyngbya sp. NK1-12]|uniref:Uncharacterized protein n=1 Tax=Leptolyngbya sp. NK1-12 TaxID=2547451 RepID=A0AA97AGU7_9CYAN|nr:hypothetical protein [Leptolyngbya sp. NK1-12]WNZ24720.1 hypothetical protein HJG54_18975 [Leptolyngbya sp. NK1-12]
MIATSLAPTPATISIDSEATQVVLKAAAAELQARFMQECGESYRVEDLQAALNRWLELSVEALLDDVLFHTVEGDRAYAFNRRAFEMQMRKLQSTSSKCAIKAA